MTVCGPLELEELVFFFGTDGPKPLVDGAVVLGSTRSVVEALALLPVPAVPVVPVVPSAFVPAFPTVILFVTRSFFDTLAVLPAFVLLLELLFFFELDEFVLFVDVFLLLELFVLLEALVFEPVRLVTRRVPSEA